MKQGYQQRLCPIIICCILAQWKSDLQKCCDHLAVNIFSLQRINRNYHQASMIHRLLLVKMKTPLVPCYNLAYAFHSLSLLLLAKSMQKTEDGTFPRLFCCFLLFNFLIPVWLWACVYIYIYWEEISVPDVKGRNQIYNLLNLVSLN